MLSQYFLNVFNFYEQKILFDYMELYKYVAKQKEIHNSILNFIDNQNSDFQNLIDFFNKQNISQNRSDLIRLLQIILFLYKNHHRKSDFFDKLFEIISYLSEGIKAILSPEELFDFFKDCPQILVFLLQKKILIPNDSIFSQIFTKSDSFGRRYYITLYPGYKSLLSKSKLKTFENKIIKKFDKNILSTIEEKLRLGENDTEICTIIRKDLIQDFVVYMNLTNSNNSLIKKSLFETNSLLNERKKVTYFEYSAFHGSLKIFQYLLSKITFTPANNNSFFCNHY